MRRRRRRCRHTCRNMGLHRHRPGIGTWSVRCLLAPTCTGHGSWNAQARPGLSGPRQPLHRGLASGTGNRPTAAATSEHRAPTPGVPARRFAGRLSAKLYPRSLVGSATLWSLGAWSVSTAVAPLGRSAGGAACGPTTARSGCEAWRAQALNAGSAPVSPVPAFRSPRARRFQDSRFTAGPSGPASRW